MGERAHDPFANLPISLTEGAKPHLLHLLLLPLLLLPLRPADQFRKWKRNSLLFPMAGVFVPFFSFSFVDFERADTNAAGVGTVGCLRSINKAGLAGARERAGNTGASV